MYVVWLYLFANTKNTKICTSVYCNIGNLKTLAFCTVTAVVVPVPTRIVFSHSNSAGTSLLKRLSRRRRQQVFEIQLTAKFD